MSQLEQYASSQNKTWAEVFNAQKLTFANIDKINNHLNNQKVPLTSTDTELVVFGSIARGECTLKSDVDWTLLVDGQASMSHLNIAHLTESAIVSTGLAEPGKSGMFGQITFSHDLIHYIGGQDDTNHNLSRRILLLLESASINNMASKEGTALDRVI